MHNFLVDDFKLRHLPNIAVPLFVCVKGFGGVGGFVCVKRHIVVLSGPADAPLVWL